MGKKMKSPPVDAKPATELESARALWHVYKIERANHYARRGIGGGCEVNVKLPTAEPESGNEQLVPCEVSAARDRKRGRANLWIKLSRKLIDHGVTDQADFIRRIFFVRGGAADAPQPNYLLSDHAWEQYVGGAETACQITGNAFRFQCQRFPVEQIIAANAGARTTEEAWSKALKNTTSDLSALFRYCLALHIATDCKTDALRRHFQKIVDNFETQAALQYLAAADAYDATWKFPDGRSWLPAGFRQIATEIYGRYYQITSATQYAEEAVNGLRDSAFASEDF